MEKECGSPQSWLQIRPSGHRPQTGGDGAGFGQRRPGPTPQLFLSCVRASSHSPCREALQEENVRREAGGFGRYLVSRLEGSGPSVRHRPCAQRRAGPGRAGPGDAGAETGGPNLQGLKTSSPNPESFRPVQKTQWLCVRNPLLAPKNVWCLGGRGPGRRCGHNQLVALASAAESLWELGSGVRRAGVRQASRGSAVRTGFSLVERAGPGGMGRGSPPGS